MVATEAELIYTKESKSRRPVDASHPMVAGAISVLEEQGGGPMTSVAIFRRGVELGVFDPNQYNSLRARLSQHCDLPEATVVRARGSKVGVRGSRTTSWVLGVTGLGVQQVPADGTLLVTRRELSPAKRRRLQRARRSHARNLILNDRLLEGAPESVRLVAGRTAREALLSFITPSAVRWLLRRLPLEAGFRSRLREAAGNLEERSVVIEAEERRHA